MQTSKVLTRPAPVKGINAYDALGFMPEGFALTLRNLFAQPYGCQVRRGYVRHVVGLPGEVESVCSHNTGADPKLYAFIDEGSSVATMYDVTTPNADGVEKLTGLTNARWQHVNFPNAAGVFLVAVNGADDAVLVRPDGTVERLSEGDGTGNTIKNVDPAKLIQVYSHHKRLWFVEAGSTRAWYLPPDQVFGVVTMFDPGANWTRGGELRMIITWTLDTGDGSDDHLAFISSEGEVSVYQGLDPDNETTWALTGVFFAGAPVAGNRVACRYGGDVLVLTQFGLVQMSDLLKSTKVNPAEGNVGKYIQQLVSAAVTLHGDLFGWQPFVFPGANMVMLNIPATDTTSYQYVQNDITKAWGEFLGYNANCWELHQQMPFFGSFGGVYRAWEQWTDDAVVADDGTVTLGTDIRSEAMPSFSFFNEGPLQKQFHLVRPVIVSAGQFTLSYSVNVNYGFNGPLSPASFDTYQSGKWDEGKWDEAQWAGGLRTFVDWLGAEGIGTNATLRLLLRSSSETYWASTDWLYEPGGVL